VVAYANGGKDEKNQSIPDGKADETLPVRLVFRRRCRIGCWRDIGYWRFSIHNVFFHLVLLCLAFLLMFVY
jgi:hypothetical protein